MGLREAPASYVTILHGLWRTTLLALAAGILLAACNDGDIRSLPEAAQTFSRITFNGETWITNESVSPPDPYVRAHYIVTTPPEGTLVWGDRVWISGTGYDNQIWIAMLGPIPTSFPATYAIVATPSVPGDAFATFDFNVSGTLGTPMACSGTSGTLTFTSYGAVGGQITGTFSTVVAGDPGCPGSYSGDFNALRANDNPF